MRILRLSYNVGDIIRYTAFGSQTRTVLVQEKDDDIKNGRPGFDGVEVHPTTLEPYGDDEDAGVWGYDDQVTAVVRRKP